MAHLGVAAVLTILAAGFALFAWPQGEDDGGGGGPLNAIAAAAEQTQTQPGGRGTIRARVTPADPSEAFTMTGEIVYNDEEEVGTIDMRMDFFDFGVIPDIEIPAEGEVFDATSMTEDELDSSAG